MFYRMAKLLCIMIAVAMVFTLMACAETAEEPEATTTAATTTAAATTTRAATTTTTAATTTEAVEENPFAEFMEISYLIRWTDHYRGERWDQLEIEEKFNVKYNVWTIDAFNGEQVTMMAAAGDWPDYGVVHRYEPNRAFDEGLIRSITLDHIRDLLPEYYAQMEANPIGFDINRIQGTENEYYGICSTYASNNYWYHVTTFRLDWLENIGMEPADMHAFTFDFADFEKFSGNTFFISNHIYAFDEFIEILRAFTEDDPNNTGIDDTIGGLFPLYGPTYGSHWTNHLTGIFGFNHNVNNWIFFDDTSGDYVPFYAHVMWRDFLDFIGDMLERGYMEYLVDLEAAYWANYYGALATGKYGHFTSDVNATLNPSSIVYLERMPYTINDNDPDAKYLLVPAIEGPDGISQGRGINRYVDLPFRATSWGSWTFGAQVTDEKLERILTILDHLHFDEYAWPRYHYGIEGVHFNWTGEPYNSAVVLNQQANIPIRYTSGTIQPLFATDRWLQNFRLWSMRSEFMYQLGEWQVKNNWYVNHTIEPDKLVDRLYMSDEMFDAFIDLRNEYNSDIFAIANEFRNGAFRGELANIRVEWPSYVERLYAAGLERYLEFFNSDDFAYYEIDIPSLYQWDE